MKKLILIIVSIVITACNFQSKTKEEIFAEQKPLPNANALRKKALEVMATKINFKDTLYVITATTVGICGNDERFTKEKRNLTAEEIAEHKAYVKANPYYLDTRDINQHNNYPPVIKSNNKTVITANYNTIGEEKLETENSELKVKRIKKPIYYIGLEIQHKDTIQVNISPFKNDEQSQFMLIRKDTLWHEL